MKLFISLLVISILSSCSSNNEVATKKPEPGLFSKDVSKGISIDNFLNRDSQSEKFYVNSFLWRASLDTLDFMPLISADYGGGIIITDWYNENNNYDDAIKISIRFLTNEIRSDALNIKVYTKKCENLNKCIVNEDNPEIRDKLISTILNKASKYKKDKKEKQRKMN